MSLPPPPSSLPPSVSEQFGSDDESSVHPPPLPPPDLEDDLNDLNSPPVPPPLDSLPENKNLPTSSSPPASPPPGIPTDEENENQLHKPPPVAPSTHRHKPPPVAPSTRRHKPPPVAPSTRRHKPPPVAPSTRHHKPPPVVPSSHHEKSNITKDISFGPPHENMSTGIEKSISFGPPHENMSTGIEKSISFGPPHNQAGRDNKNRSTGNSNTPPPITPRGTPKQHDDDKDRGQNRNTSTGNSNIPPPITPRGTPKQHDDSSKEKEKKEQIPPPPPPQISILTKETHEEDDYESLPDDPPPKITSDTVLQSFDYGIPPPKSTANLWDSLDKIVESNEHDSTTTDEEADDDDDEVVPIPRRPSEFLKRPEKKVAGDPFQRHQSTISIKPPPAELLEKIRSSPYSTRRGSSYESRRKKSKSHEDLLSSNNVELRKDTTIDIDTTVFHSEIEEERRRFAKLREEYENHEVMMAKKEKKYHDNMRLSTLERDEIVYRMEVAQEENRKSLLIEESEFEKELASQREHFVSEIETKQREILKRDDEIQERRREISQEDAESALRVEMTEMRIKDLAERAQKMVADAKNRSERSEMTWKWELAEMQRKHSGVVSRLEHLVLSTRQKVSSEVSDSANTIRTQENKIERLQQELYAAETEMNTKIKMLKWESVNRAESMERALRTQCTAEVMENKKLLEQTFSRETSEAMSEIRSRLNEARSLSHDWRKKNARAMRNHSHAVAELQQHERELAISRSECELLRNRLREAEEEVSFGRHGRDHLLSILSQSVPPGLNLKGDKMSDDDDAHHSSADEEGYESVDENEDHDDMLLIGEGSELMQNMEANLKKAENSLRRLSERIGMENDSDIEDVKNEVEDAKTPHRQTYDTFRKFCGSLARRSRRKPKQQKHDSTEGSGSRNSPSVLESMIATRMPSSVDRSSALLSPSSFTSGHTVLKSLEKSHLRKHISNTPKRQRNGVLRIARTLLLCSSKSTLLPVIQRKLCDALWNHSHVFGGVRVLSFKSLWLAATRCLEYGRVTKKALKEQFDAIESRGVVEYMELVRALQRNVARV